MIVETLSTFPHMYDSVMGSSMMKRAQDKGILRFAAYDLRDWTHDRHRTTDDDPYGGGAGLVMKCEPIFEALRDIAPSTVARFLGEPAPADDVPADVIFLAPQGRRFDDAYANELAAKERLLFVCGHYEGIDERAYEVADHVISLGDYVLTSGELASMVVIDAVVRKLEGVLGAEDGAVCSSIRSTRARRRSMGGRFPPCCSRAITGRWRSGAGSRASSARCAGGPTCWRRPKRRAISRPLTGNIC